MSEEAVLQSVETLFWNSYNSYKHMDCMGSLLHSWHATMVTYASAQLLSNVALIYLFYSDRQNTVQIQFSVKNYGSCKKRT